MSSLQNQNSQALQKDKDYASLITEPMYAATANMLAVVMGFMAEKQGMFFNHDALVKRLTEASHIPEITDILALDIGYNISLLQEQNLHPDLPIDRVAVGFTEMVLSQEAGLIKETLEKGPQHITPELPMENLYKHEVDFKAMFADMNAQDVQEAWETLAVPPRVEFIMKRNMMVSKAMQTIYAQKPLAPLQLS